MSAFQKDGNYRFIHRRRKKILLRYLDMVGKHVIALFGDLIYISKPYCNQT